jgi:signal transduction histidine kinase
MQLNTIALLITIFINCLLGIVVFFAAPKSQENRHFFFLIFSVFLWTTALLLYPFVDDPTTAITISKIAYFSAGFTALSVLNFAIFFVFQNLNKARATILSVINLSLLVLIGLLTYDGLLLKKFIVFNGHQRVIEFGPLYVLYIVLFSVCFIFAFAILYLQYKKETGDVRKKQMEYIIGGIFTTVMGNAITNIVLPTLGNFDFYWFGPIFTLITIGSITIAVSRYHLFNTKVIATELLVASLWIVLLARTLMATTTPDLVINGGLLFVTIILGLLLARSVLNEVRTREEIQKLATELEFANKELKRLDQAKSEFISIASHQLRTPLSIIKGYISMIREGSYGIVPDSMKKTLNKIYLSNERLIKLVADLLDLSRMESGKMKYEFANFNFVELVDSIVDEFKMPATDKGLDLRWTPLPEPLNVWGDSWKLRQVIFNLIDNSLKYTETGWIEVAIQPQKDIVTLTVKDSGIGMSPDTAHALFQKFSRGHDSSKANAQGLGLGLFIAKKIMDDHRGRLWPESPGEGKGSTFFFQMPIKQPPPSPATTFDSFIKGM